MPCSKGHGSLQSSRIWKFGKAIQSHHAGGPTYRRVRFAKEIQVSRPLTMYEHSHVYRMMMHLECCSLCSSELLESYHPSFTVEPLCELGRDRARIINDYAYFENHQILSGFDRHSDKFPVHLEVPFNLRPMVNLLRAIARGYYPRKTVWCELESSNVVEVSRALGRVMTVRGERIVVTVATRNTCPVKNEGIIHKTHIAPSLSR